MSDLISRDEARGKFQTVTEWNGEVHRYIDEQSLDSIPSADIMECVRAVKEYCENRKCEECDFADHNISRSTICGLHYACPCGWDLPEGKKGGE